MRAHLLTIVGYVFSTLLVQGTSHFAVNAAHYAEVSYARASPIFALGIASMIVQAAVLSWVYANSRWRDGSLLSAMTITWLFGAFLVSYIALAEAGKYAVPDIGSWILTETLVAAVQFTLIGGFLWLAHRWSPALRAA